MAIVEPKQRPQMKLAGQKVGAERRSSRRHDLETHQLAIEKWDNKRRNGEVLGEIVDLSSGGVRIRTRSATNIRPDQQVCVRLALPPYAGICAFVDTSAPQPQPRTDWVGWMAVARVNKVDGKTTEVAGRLMDMDEMDRGMLGLYLSTQPLAA